MTPIMSYVLDLELLTPRVFLEQLLVWKKYGSHRVFDVPASENALIGFAIGASLNSSIPILTHQRLDFALLSMDQIINGAAKWLYMFEVN